MTRVVVAVVAVEAVLWMKGAKTLVEGNKIEALVEEVVLHDTLHVRRAVEVVGCSGEGEGNAVQMQELLSEWEQKQGGWNWLPQACAIRSGEMRREKEQLLKTHLENSRVYYFVKKKSLKESICQLRMCYEERSRLVWVGNHECLLQFHDEHE
jgi:hypothetical protein